MKKRILFIFLCIIGGNTLAQNPEKKPLALQFKSHYGFIIPHSQELIDVSQSYPWGGELTFAWLQNSEEAWQSCQCFSQKGISIKYFNYAFPDVLGSSVAVVPFIEPFIKAKNRFYGSVRAELGVVYLSEVYDAETNPSNLFFSYPISFFLGVQGNMYYKLNPQWQLVASANYNHISNGGIKQPNKGMNFPTFSLGASYSFKDVQFSNFPKNKFDKNNRQNRTQIWAIYCAKNTPETDEFESELKSIGGLAVSRHIQLGALSYFIAGSEALYNSYTKELVNRQGQSGNYWEWGLLAGHELNVGRVSFSQQLGVYLWNQFRDTDGVYQRYSIGYRFTPKLVLAGTLKAHRNVADMLDVRVGYIF